MDEETILVLVLGALFTTAVGLTVFVFLQRLAGL